MIFSRQKTTYQSELDQLFIELKKSNPDITQKQQEGISFLNEQTALEMNRKWMKKNQISAQKTVNFDKY